MLVRDVLRPTVLASTRLAGAGKDNVAQVGLGAIGVLARGVLIPLGADRGAVGQVRRVLDPHALALVLALALGLDRSWRGGRRRRATWSRQGSERIAAALNEALVLCLPRRPISPQRADQTHSPRELKWPTSELNRLGAKLGLHSVEEVQDRRLGVAIHELKSLVLKFICVLVDLAVVSHSDHLLLLRSRRTELAASSDNGTS